MYSQRVCQFLLCLMIIGVPMGFIQAQSNTIGDSKNQNSGALASGLKQYFNQSKPICDITILQDLTVEMSEDKPYQPEEWPSCKGVTLHAPHWITFIAGSEEFSLEIEVDECMKENGVQVAVYKLPSDIHYGPDQVGLLPEGNVGNSITGCYYAQNPQKGKIKFSTNTEPGELFGLLIDGWNGDLCQLKFNVLKGETLPGIQDQIDGTISYGDLSVSIGVDTICNGALDVPFRLEAEVEGAKTFIWTLNGTPLAAEDQSGKTAYMDFTLEGENEVCVMATNHCDTTEALCVNIPVETLTKEFNRDTICEGETFGWWQDNDLIGLFGPFTSFDGDTSLFYSFHSDQGHCRNNWTKPLTVKGVNLETPVEKDTFARFNDLPISIMDTLLYKEVENITLSNTSETGTNACKTYYDLDLYVLGGKFSIEMNCTQDPVTFSFSGIDDTRFYSSWEKQFEFIFEHPQLEYEFRWNLNSSEHMTGREKNLLIQRDSLVALSEEGILTIGLQLVIRYQGEEWLNVKAPDLEIPVDEYFTGDDLVIEEKGDSLMVVPQLFSDYQWYRCGEYTESLPSETNPFLIPTETGSYSVQVSNGYCYSFLECYDYTHFESTYSSRLAVFPNPATGQITVSVNENLTFPSRVEIYSITGKPWIDLRYEKESQIDISLLPEGLYILKMGDKTLKFVKSN